MVTKKIEFKVDKYHKIVRVNGLYRGMITSEKHLGERTFFFTDDLKREKALSAPSMSLAEDEVREMLG